MNKLKVLLVDDENIVLEDMASLINWDENGFFLCGCAYNGKQAIKAVKNNPPDLIFMDISLPDTDGITLSRKLRNICPELLIIVLSGYMDFTYAQGAVEIGAFSYLVKHQLTAERLAEVLKNARDVLEKKHLTAVLNRRLLLRDILEHNTQVSPLISEALSAYQDVFLPILIVPVLPPSQCDSMCSIPIHQPHISSLMQIQEKNLRVQDVILWHTNYLILLVPGRDSCAGARYLDSLPWILRRLVNAFEYENSVSFTALYLNQETTLCTLQADVKMLEEQKDFWRFHPEKKFLSVPSDCCLEESSNLDFLTCDCFLDSFDDFIDQLLSVFEGYKKKQNIALWMECYTQLMGVLNQVAPDVHNTMQECYISELTEALLEQCRSIYKNLQAKKQYSPATNYTLQYISENYQKGPTISDAAIKLKTNPMYLGQKFRHETGYTFHDYLNKYRIEKAKELLLKPDWKIFEISEMVGISNSQYFSKLFRQFTGMTPNEYRRKYFS